MNAHIILSLGATLSLFSLHFVSFGGGNEERLRYFCRNVKKAVFGTCRKAVSTLVTIVKERIF